jgi:HK97 family phage major capsid protein
MEMTLEQVVGAVAKELNLEKLFGDDKNRAALAVIINKATADLEQKLTSEIAEERKLRTAAEVGIAELRERMTRREKLERDFDFHVGRDGKTIMPTLSRECGEHLLALMRGKGKAFDEARALSAGTDSEGGYMVAPEFAAEIIRLLPTVGLYRRLARIIPMKTDEKNFGTLVSSVSTYWPAENNNITASYPVFGQLKLIAKLMGAYTEGPENLFDDADPDLINFIGDLFIEAMAKEEDRVGLAGATGSGDAFDGILNITGTTSLVMASTKTHYSDVTADHLLDLQTTVPDGARDNCIYVLSPTMFDFVRKMKDNNLNYIWQAPSAGAPGTIWGKPYELTERLPAYSASVNVSKPFIAYGAPKYLILGDRKQIMVRTSDVAGGTFQKVQVAIRAHERVSVNSYAGAWAKLVTAAS